MSQQLLNNLEQILPRQSSSGRVSDPLFLPVHRDLAIALEKQGACAANFQCFGLRTAESHFAWLFLPFECRFIQDNPREIRRQGDLWKSERMEHELAITVEGELLADDGIECYIRATTENWHVLHEPAVGDLNRLALTFVL